ncbi:MAG: YebC/PmpR family DNA-binding transcriptional regulator [Saccharofermentanales bacterium]|jgi:YebC/PmpR family DNA-binding regulatory protein|nr:YebC/PmpR family DNA-binding transcriptional regulator [Fastidiosipila sp.]
MAGHSKWNNIKRRKAAEDNKRGKIFSKFGKEIQVAVREGGPDPEQNSRLRDIITRAKSSNMPNDNIQRSIDKAAGDTDSGKLIEIIYEGYGPGGIAVMVRALSENRNRTAGDVRHIFDKYGGNLGTDGSAAFLFERKGSIIIERENIADEDELLMLALDAGAEDIDLDNENIVDIMTTPQDYDAVTKTISQHYEVLEQSLGPVPLTWNKLSDPDQVTQMENLIEKLEDNDDVQDVYHNWEQDEE